MAVKCAEKLTAQVQESINSSGKSYLHKRLTEIVYLHIVSLFSVKFYQGLASSVLHYTAHLSGTLGEKAL